MKSESPNRKDDCRPIEMMSFAAAIATKVKKTASRKMTVDFFGVLRNRFVVLMASEESSQMARTAPNSRFSISDKFRSVYRVQFANGSKEPRHLPAADPQ